MGEKQGGGGAVRIGDRRVRMLYRTSLNKIFEGLNVACGTILVYWEGNTTLMPGSQYLHNDCLASESESYTY